MMRPKSLISGPLEVRLAKDDREIEAIQRLRYQVFYEETASRLMSPEMAREKRDFDLFDEVCDHLIAIDHETGEVVGGYRLISEEAARAKGGFFTSHEFDLSRLNTYPGRKLELGRACVAVQYRTQRVMALLWQGIEGYIRHYNITLLFGCANFPGIDPSVFDQAFSFLYHFYLVPEWYRPIALPTFSAEMNRLPKEEINVRVAFRQLPPLVRGYLRLGGGVGQGIYIDHNFRSLDVCIVVETKKLAQRYVTHYARRSS